MWSELVRKWSVKNLPPHTGLCVIFMAHSPGYSCQRSAGLGAFAACLGAITLLFAVAGFTLPANAEAIAPRQAEGLIHGFVTVRTLDGKRIADGEVTQRTAGKQLTLRVDLRFLDGSRHDDTVKYEAAGHIKVIEERLIQKGPTFPTQIETLIDPKRSLFRVTYKDEKGKSDTIEEQMEIPADMGNGLLLTLIKHVDPQAAETRISWIAATPKPRLVNLVITPSGREVLSHGVIKAETIHYVVRTEIGGLSGLIAPLIGKQPPDIHIWMLAGDAPGFVKFEGPLFSDGPVWRIEVAAPQLR